MLYGGQKLLKKDMIGKSEILCPLLQLLTMSEHRCQSKFSTHISLIFVNDFFCSEIWLLLVVLTVNQIDLVDNTIVAFLASSV